MTIYVLRAHHELSVKISRPSNDKILIPGFKLPFVPSNKSSQDVTNNSPYFNCNLLRISLIIDNRLQTSGQSLSKVIIMEMEVISPL